MLSDEYSEELYKVEKIINKREDEYGRIMYYVKWFGYPEEANTWELEENLNDIESLVKNYESQASQSTLKTFFNDYKQIMHKSETRTPNLKPPVKHEVKGESIKRITNKTEVIDLTSDTDAAIPSRPVISEINLSPLPVKASLDIDIPYCVKWVKKTTQGTWVEIEWMPRSDGITPNNELITYKTVRAKYPQLLIDFYEDRLITNKTKISKK
jgi:hypothetical protein